MPGHFGIFVLASARPVFKLQDLARRFAVLGCIALTILVSTKLQAAAGDRIALVVGNSDYRKVPKLINPANDAADMSSRTSTAPTASASPTSSWRLPASRWRKPRARR